MKKEIPFGVILSPILEDLEITLLAFEEEIGTKPEYSIEGFRAATKIFMSVVMDKMWELQEKENIDIQIRKDMAIKAGEEIKKLIKTYCNIDTYTLYKEIK